jgi:hypothetical protein
MKAAIALTIIFGSIGGLAYAVGMPAPTYTKAEALQTCAIRAEELAHEQGAPALAPIASIAARGQALQHHEQGRTWTEIGRTCARATIE